MKTNRLAFLSGEFTRFPNGSLMPGGCTYYRSFLPMHMIGMEASLGLPAWTSQHGFGVKDGEKKALFGYGIVFLKQLMDRWLPHQITVAKELGQKIVVDIDDFYHALHEDNNAYTATDPEKNKVRNRDIYEEIISLADLVTVSTPVLADFYRRFNPNIHIVRNVVYAPQFNRRAVSKNKPVLGWVGALGYRSGDIETLQDWLPGFLEEHDLMFHHSGYQPQHGPDFAARSGIDPARLTSSPMRPFSHYKEMFSFDIGLVPLNKIPFNEAKSNLKGLEYAVSGIPFVATDTDEYRLLPGVGIGRVAASPEEWMLHLKMLLDYRERKRDSATNYAIVQKRYSIEERAEEWQRIVALLQ